MANNPWKQFFDEHAPKYMQNVFTRNTIAEVDFLCEIMNLPAGGSILDIGCGTGRHAVELAGRGYQVTGVDLSSGMLAEARRVARAAGVTVRWIQCDATAFHADRLNHAAICLCEGAFGLLSHDDDPLCRDLEILRNIFDALRPGGMFVGTVLNALRMIRHHSQTDVAAGRFDPLTLTETNEVECDTANGKKPMTVRERGFTPPELHLMLRKVGFMVEQVWGGTAGNWGRRPVDLDEMEIMIVAAKPA